MKASDIPMKALDIPDTLDPWPLAQEDSGQAGFAVFVFVCPFNCSSTLEPFNCSTVVPLI
jgi:hypothetical protein